MQELENFENELLMMIKIIQIRNLTKGFQSQLNGDIEQLNPDSKIPDIKSRKDFHENVTNITENG